MFSFTYNFRLNDCHLIMCALPLFLLSESSFHALYEAPIFSAASKESAAHHSLRRSNRRHGQFHARYVAAAEIPRAVCGRKIQQSERAAAEERRGGPDDLRGKCI